MAGDRWIFAKTSLMNTPSRKNGIDIDKELSYRQLAASLIQDMGQRLTVTQLCINTAIVYMHRFYMVQSFSRFPRQEIAPACIFLAAKVEEQPRKLELVIRAANSCSHREPIDIKSEAYLEQAQTLVINENILLQTLGFDVRVDHPHTHVVKTCQLVRASKDLAQTSYFLATNSLHLTTFCLQCKPTILACVCIHLACKWSNWEIPKSSEGKEWYYYVDKNITLELLEEYTQEFLNILDKCPSKLKKKIMGWKAGGREHAVKDEELQTGVPPEKCHQVENPPPSAAEAGSSSAVKSDGNSGLHKLSGHEQKLDSRQQPGNSNASSFSGSLKKEHLHPYPRSQQPASSSKSSQEGHVERPLLDGGSLHLAGSLAAEFDAKRTKPDAMSIKAYLERKEKERKQTFKHEYSRPIAQQTAKHDYFQPHETKHVPSVSNEKESVRSVYNKPDFVPNVCINQEFVPDNRLAPEPFPNILTKHEPVPYIQFKLESSNVDTLESLSSMHNNRQDSVPSIHIKEEAVPKIIIKQEREENYNQSALDKSYSTTAVEKRQDKKSKSEKEGIQNSKVESKSSKLQKKDEIPSVKIHLKPILSPGSHAVKQESSSPLKLKISTSHLKDELKHSGDKNRSKDHPHHHSKSQRGDLHHHSSHSSHEKSADSPASGTNGKLKLHIKMSDGQKRTYQSSLSNDLGAQTSNIKQSHRHGSSHEGKHSWHKEKAGTSLDTVIHESHRDSRERHSHPWTVSDLLSQSTSEINHSPARKRRRIPSSSEQKMDRGRLRRSSSSHSIVDMELSDNGSSGEILSPNIRQNSSHSNRGSGTNSPHFSIPQSHQHLSQVSQVHHQLQQLIELKSRHIARQMSQQTSIGAGFDLDAYCNPSPPPPLPAEPPPRPPSPPSAFPPTSPL
ncbi:hypothetical protein CHS0354_023252 [Potamilus streckersoni]|uniref:Cyclin-like domain-containing protein n=1 Tax=Potamilus streckersoni TaxID=2493646 RepID=A0AAE0S3R5_9BIVA|nr:hypothetical protein CHS0354_023252 [Potamilus streckersoni]